MRYRINQIRLGIDEEAADFAEVIRKKLRKPDLVVSRPFLESFSSDGDLPSCRWSFSALDVVLPPLMRGWSCVCIDDIWNFVKRSE